MRKFIKNNSLNIVVLALFLMCLALQSFSGWKVYNEEQAQENKRTIGFAEYVSGPHFGEALFENWESEFLQMGLFVWLTSFLLQKGSAESNKPDDEEQNPPTALTPESPWAARQGGMTRWIYSRSLPAALFVLFALSLYGHANQGAAEYSEKLMERGLPPVNWWGYLFTARFWFESMQNWQSEFLAVSTLSILSIWLRQENSPESKPVNKPHNETGAD
jgi:hypothetical protein